MYVHISESLTRGDCVFSLARITALTLAQNAFSKTRACGLQSLVFAGHFPDVSGVRDLITAELIMQNESIRQQNVNSFRLHVNIFMSLFFLHQRGETVDFKFLRYGGSYGALGCFILPATSKMPQ